MKLLCKIWTSATNKFKNTTMHYRSLIKQMKTWKTKIMNRKKQSMVLKVRTWEWWQLLTKETMKKLKVSRLVSLMSSTEDLYHQSLIGVLHHRYLKVALFSTHLTIYSMLLTLAGTLKIPWTIQTCTYKTKIILIYSLPILMIEYSWQVKELMINKHCEDHHVLIKGQPLTSRIIHWEVCTDLLKQLFPKNLDVNHLWHSMIDLCHQLHHRLVHKRLWWTFLKEEGSVKQHNSRLLFLVQRHLDPDLFLLSNDICKSTNRRHLQNQTSSIRSLPIEFKVLLLHRNLLCIRCQLNMKIQKTLINCNMHAASLNQSFPKEVHHP